MMVIFLLLCSFSVSVVGKNHAFIQEKFFSVSSQLYENHWDFSIEVNNYGQIQVIWHIRKSYERSDNVIVKTFDPVPSTSQYFPENAFRIRIFDFETYLTSSTYLTGRTWEKCLEIGAIKDYIWLDYFRTGSRVKPLKVLLELIILYKNLFLTLKQENIMPTKYPEKMKRKFLLWLIMVKIIRSLETLLILHK